jgi:arginyl-tRNA synthetase
VAQGFSRFYAAHHVLSEADPARKAALLGLASLTLSALETALQLLGIEVPERM